VKVVEAEEKKCRLHEFYPALAGYCLWNEFECGQIEFSPAQVFKKPN
jgi:hypothetical protein